MSGVVKSVGKVFKKVAKAVKKVLPIVLAAAAIYFTAGAALGVAGTAGGWGSAVSGMVSKMGGTGMLGKVLTGAITQAGYGAAAGGAMSLITGGDVMEGLQRGALTGAVTGGVMGGLGLQTDPFKGIGEGADDAITGSVGTETLGGGPAGADTLGVDHLPSVGPAPSSQVSGNLPNISGGQSVGVHPIDQLQNVPVTGAAPTMPPATTVGTVPGHGQPGVAPAPGVDVGGSAPASSSPGFLEPGGWLERNQALAGYGVAGLGQGLMAAGDSGDSEAAMRLALERDQNQADRIRANYGDGSIPGYRQLSAPTGNPTPVQRFDPKQYQGTYQYDPGSGRIVFVPESQQATA